MNIDQATIDAMDRLGGSFVKSLAECYLRADPANKTRLVQAFPEYFCKYQRIAKQIEPES